MTLHLVGLDVRGRDLVARARRRGLPMRDLDTGYLVHSWLEGAFGEGVVRPFAVVKEVDGVLRLRGYSALSADELRDRAQRFGDLDGVSEAEWDTLRGRPLPDEWPSGLRAGFEVRVCPTVRTSGTGEEIDAFLAAVRTAGDQPVGTREEVYGRWLAAALERSGGATVESASVVSFRLARMLRRTQGASRESRRPMFPDVRMEGTLSVRDSAAFQALLARGVGRHRAFGFGMLLLSAPR